MSATHHPAVFDQPDEAAARAIILTPEGSTTDERWERETPYLVGLIREYCRAGAGANILDFGCGIGRIAKALLDDPEVRAVVGLDASGPMRALAEEAIADQRFVAANPATTIPTQAFDTAVAVWVLQHVADPVLEVARIRAFLRPGGRLFVVNNLSRAVPTAEDGRFQWVDDGFNVVPLLRACFREVIFGRLDTGHVAPHLADTTFWAVYERD